MSALDVGDAVTVNDYPDWIGLVLDVTAVLGEADLLTLDVPPGGRTYLTAADVTRIDKPRVEAGQVWTCDETGSTVRALAPSWMSPAVWETETLVPAAGHWVGTVILAHPAWRLVDPAHEGGEAP